MEDILIVAPGMDLNPMHPYWPLLWAAGFGFLILFAVFYFLSHNNGKLSMDQAWFFVSVVVAILHSPLSAFVFFHGEAHSYTIVSSRYVSPSPAFFYFWLSALVIKNNFHPSRWIWKMFLIFRVYLCVACVAFSWDPGRVGLVNCLYGKGRGETHTQGMLCLRPIMSVNWLK